MLKRELDYWQRIRQAVGKETLILPGAAGAITHNGKILLVRHNLLKKWQIPGGTQEIGESIQQTAEREIKEELGLDLTAGSLISIYSHPKWTIELPNGDKIQQLTFFFAMEGEISTVSIQASEIHAYQFFAPDEIPEDTFDCCKQKVVDWKTYQGQVKFR
jgi:8-oxo-dGTP pyrophosphatase MutT (NUDIX family)